MKILALNWRCLRHPQAGGGEVNLFEQAEHWVNAGHSVTVICADPGRERAPHRLEQINGVTIMRMGGQFSVYARTAWFLLTKGQDYDCILDVSNGIPFFSTVFSSLPSVLFVHHVHDQQWFTEFPKPIAAFGKFLECTVVPYLYRRHKVITVSSTTYDDLLRIGYQKSNIAIVANGVSLTRPVCPPPLLKGPRVLYLGRLKRYKRVDKVIEAVAQLAQANPDVHLDIAGDGDARVELEALVAELGMQHHVTFHGFIDETTKLQLLLSATVFANASMHEGWGISVIEANACGCPAVAYNVPGLNAAIKHGETGLLAENDVEFVQALSYFLNTPDARSQYATAARKWAAGFEWEKSARESCAILSQVYRDNTPRAAIL